MRIAWCLLVHKNPSQVVRIINRLYSPEDHFIINVFKTNETPSLSDWREVSSQFGDNCFISSNHRASYGRMGMVYATLDAMRLFHESNYDYFVNPTGQCYPLKSIKQIKDTLANGNLAHIEHFRLPSSEHWGPQGGLDRINSRWFKFRGHKIGIPRAIKRLPYGLSPYGGSDWFCMPRKHVEYTIDFVSRNPKTLNFFSRSHSPSEMFFQTILMNSQLSKEIVNVNEWYIDWKRAVDGHPPVLTKTDLPKLLESPKLFARKFDTKIDSEVLDLIDKAIS